MRVAKGKLVEKNLLKQRVPKCGNQKYFESGLGMHNFSIPTSSTEQLHYRGRDTFLPVTALACAGKPSNSARRRVVSLNVS